MTFVALRARSVAVRSSCYTPGSAPPSCNCFNALAWWTCRRAMACWAEAACPAAPQALAVRVDENIQALDGRRGLPLQAAAPCGQSCMAIPRSTGGISGSLGPQRPSHLMHFREERNRRRLPAISLRSQEPIVQP